MVWPQYSNLKCDFWLHRCSYSIAEKSLCLFHASQELGAPILEALVELKSEVPPSQRTLTIAQSSRASGLTSLQLKSVPSSPDLRVMNIQCTAEVGTIEMTDMGLTLMIDAVSKWLAGNEDFGVSPRNAGLKKHELGNLDLESSELWFWGPYYAGP